MRVGYHASHEQFAPSELLDHVVAAEAAGFDAAMCSDHFSPWSKEQGHSGFAWAWLGAALSRTQLTFGCVTAPGYRYHPAVVAQAAATLAEMYPGRFWMALGSGEYLNEHITGRPWPPREQRMQHLVAAADAVKRLVRGEEVTRSDGPSPVQDARLWVDSLPPPQLLAAALTPESAARATWADGLIIAPASPDSADELIRSYRDAGGTGPVLAQIAIAYHEDDNLAVSEAHQRWRQVALQPEQLSDLATVEDFEAATAAISPEAVRERIFVSSDLSAHASLLSAYAGLGVHTAYLHNVCADQARFIRNFGREPRSPILRASATA